eukprot:203064-Amorphochlora_amoeboformis.AAC.1
MPPIEIDSLQHPNNNNNNIFTRGCREKPLMLRRWGLRPGPFRNNGHSRPISEKEEGRQREGGNEGGREQRKRAERERGEGEKARREKRERK